MDGNSQVEIDDLKGGVEHITFKVTRKLLSNHEVNHLRYFIFFVCYPFLFLELNGILGCKLKENCFLTFAYKLINYLSIKIAVVESKKEGTRNVTFQSFNIYRYKFSNLEANIAGKIVEYSWAFFFLKNFICRELSNAFFSEMLDQLGFHALYLSYLNYKTDIQ